MIGSVVFMILYIVPTMLILVNMYIGIMLQAYSEVPHKILFTLHTTFFFPMKFHTVVQ